MFGAWVSGQNFAVLIARGRAGLALAVFAAFVFSLSGCSPSGSDNFDSESVIAPSCQVAHDQRLSFMAKVAAFPLQLNADASFSGPERASIETAVSRWNALGQQLIGQDFYTLQYTELASSFHSADPRDCSVE